MACSQNIMYIQCSGGAHSAARDCCLYKMTFRLLACTRGWTCVAVWTKKKHNWLKPREIKGYQIGQKYDIRSESKERLRIQPSQVFHCTRSVMWCVQQSVDSYLLQLVQWTFSRCECNGLWQLTRRYQIPPTGRCEAWFGFCRRKTLDPVKFTEDFCSLWRTCYESGQCRKMVHNV